MFKKIHIQNFQSLRNVELELSPFTVIVGATDSGKSATFRAIRTLISNQRGADFITHGEKTCTITAELAQGTLTLRRGKGTNDNFYETNDLDGHIEHYTKLSGTVPEEVSEFLKIPSKDPINLASQFDKPYLLDTKEYGPTEVARILGALTNVNLLFEGAREANRQKLQTSATIKTRASDLEGIESRKSAYDGLESKLQSITAAEEAAETALKLQHALSTLEDLVSRAEAAQSVCERVSGLVDVEVPDITELERLNTAIQTLEKLISSAESQTELTKKRQEDIDTIEVDIVSLEEKYNETLRKAGTCPVCQQTTESL